ncbi:MAG: hypothetical protein ACD_62C00205G0001, partial [uncultured bacterium]
MSPNLIRPLVSGSDFGLVREHLFVFAIMFFKHE